MPTLCGLRRRGYTPSSIRNFCEKIGVTKINSLTDVALLEHCLREDLNKKAYRVMGVLNPLKVIITNYPDDQVEEMEAINNPEDSSAGTRKVPFSKVLYIEKDDFMEDAPKKFFRLTVGREVRLRYAYFVTCTDIIKDENGEIVEIHCTYDPASKGGNSPDGRKVKGTIHWVSASHALNAEVRLYDRLFSDEKPDEGDYKNSLNPDSLKILKNCLLEPSLKGAELGVNYQFERIGYFILDSQDSPNLEGMPVFNRTVSLRDSWSKIMKKMKK
jgi:glutaminyl-tRNA synthetase